MSDDLDSLPVLRLHLAIVLVCAFGFGFDLLEISLGSVLSAVFSTGAHRIGTGQLSWLLSSVYVGAIVGAPLFGGYADRKGRRAALLLALVCLCVTSTSIALTEDVGLLAFLRLISGLALGAFPPLVMAYLTDILPARQRGTLIFLAVSLAYLGPPAGLLLVHHLTSTPLAGIEGWRWGFALAAVGSGVCAALQLRLPESPRWLFAAGRTAAAVAALQRFRESRPIGAPRAPEPVRQARSPAISAGAPAVPIGFMLALFFIAAWSTAGLPLLNGAALVQKGVRLSETVLYLAFANLGSVASAALAVFVADRFDRRVSLAACAGSMILAGVIFALTSSSSLLVSSVVLYTVAATLFLPVLTLYAAEAVATRGRAAATSAMWAANRLGAAIAPLALVPVLRQHGVAWMVAIVVATLACCVVLLWRLGPRGMQRLAIS